VSCTTGLFTEVNVWDAGLSNPALLFSNSAVTVKRPNSAYSYPAAFAKLPTSRAALEVCLNAAPLNGNWLSFGLTKTGLENESSDGLGRTVNSWGIADDRAPAAGSEMPLVAANAERLSRLPRKLRSCDVLLGFVDVTAGWFEVRLNQTEFVHRFTIPPGAKEDYWFGMTLASDHQVSVISANPPAAAPAPVPAPVPKPAPKPAPAPVPRPPSPDDESCLYDPVYVPNNGPPPAPRQSTPITTQQPPLTPRGATPAYLTAFRHRCFEISQQAAHAPARKEWMTRRDELKQQSTAAQQADDKDWALIASTGIAVTAHDSLSGTLLLTEEACGTLPTRHAALKKEMETKCAELTAAGDFVSLKDLAAELTNLSKLKV
jgi:hypothetical protein